MKSGESEMCDSAFMAARGAQADLYRATAGSIANAIPSASRMSAPVFLGLESPIFPGDMFTSLRPCQSIISVIADITSQSATFAAENIQRWDSVDERKMTPAYPMAAREISPASLATSLLKNTSRNMARLLPFIKVDKWLLPIADEGVGINSFGFLMPVVPVVVCAVGLRTGFWL